jgi:hypothetical protein
MKKSKAAHDLGVNSKLGNPSNEHWEVKVPCTAYGDGDDPAGAFLPTPGKDRAQPHQKINETDH